jgi:hypothetical protein
MEGARSITPHKCINYLIHDHDLVILKDIMIYFSFVGLFFNMMCCFLQGHVVKYICEISINCAPLAFACCDIAWYIGECSFAFTKCNILPFASCSLELVY